MKHWKCLVLVLIVAGTVAGCAKQEEPAAQAPAAAPAAQEPQMPASHPPLDGDGGQMAAPAGPRQVQVPADVQTAWKSVVLEVTNRSAETSQDVEIEIGKSVVVEGLEITVGSFVPHFSMGGGTITSASGDTVNPAAQLTVKEGDKEVFSGWLFSLYPEAHPFQHDTYGIVLKDFKKSE